jgi:Acetyltransferase (GNAT) domain
MEQGENESVTGMSFHVGPAPAQFKLAYQPYLFNTHLHRALQSKTGWKEFHWLDRDSKTVLISIYFNTEDGLAKNPFRAPFGGFEIADGLQTETLSTFLLEFEMALSQDKIEVIEIFCPPELYSKNQPLITSALVNKGYEIVLTEPGACIVIDGTSLANKMAKDKLTRLKKCEKAGILFKEIGLEKINEVYTFIEACRSKQERKLSMTLEDLTKTVEALPESFFIVGVYDKQKLIAASICIRVSPSIIYTFYSAHDAEYNDISPQVFLLGKLYDWCATHGVTLLDLGTSALDGQPNAPLLDFKLRMGATATPKFKFRKTLG